MIVVDSVTSPPSALYGQPSWWGQDDRLEGEEFMEEKEEDSRQRSDTYTSNGKGNSDQFIKILLTVDVIRS